MCIRSDHKERNAKELIPGTKISLCGTCDISEQLRLLYCLSHHTTMKLLIHIDTRQALYHIKAAPLPVILPSAKGLGQREQVVSAAEAPLIVSAGPVSSHPK